MEFVIRHKPSDSYIKTYFGGRWKEGYILEKAQIFDTTEEAQTFINLETSIWINKKTGKPITPDGWRETPDNCNFHCVPDNINYEIFPIESSRKLL